MKKAICLLVLCVAMGLPSHHRWTQTESAPQILAEMEQQMVPAARPPAVRKVKTEKRIDEKKLRSALSMLFALPFTQGAGAG